MIIESLRLLDFRTHADSRIDFQSRMNLVHGPNGAGKTNCLEAVHFLAMSKSFLTNSDTYAVRNGCRSFQLEGSFRNDAGTPLHVHLGFAKEEGKRIHVNKAPLDRLVEIVGRIPIVTFSPADIALTAEGPEVRRQFLNHTLSQSKPSYLFDIIKYRKALRQRNALLMDAKRSGRADEALLSAWTAELMNLARRIGLARGTFVSAFSEVLRRAFSRFSVLGEEPHVRYKYVNQGQPCSEDEVAARLSEDYSRVRDREPLLGRTLFGPHLDEIVFFLNEMPVRQYASRGQHRTFALALKLATYLYLKERMDELPILLLDDVFAELDNRRSEVLAQLLVSDTIGQSIITIAELEPLFPLLSFNQQVDRRIRIENGEVDSSEGSDNT